MGYVEIIQAVGPWPIELIPRATIGQLCVRMQLLMSRSVTSASDKNLCRGYQHKT